MILEELNVPYTYKMIELLDMKKEAYELINPNGRVSAIKDPNIGITLWESGAIIKYLVEIYNKQRNISFITGLKEYYEAK
jgi:glutathione S-transferase